MKKIVMAAALLLAQAALTVQSHAAEPPRRHIRPYTSFAAAAADVSVNLPGGTPSASAYISPVTDIARAENDGQTRFSSSFVYPAAWLNRQLLLRIGSASAGYTLFVNGVEAGRATCGTEPAEFNVTKLSHQGINEFCVLLDSADSSEPLLAPGVAWIGRVEVLSQPTIRLRDVDVHTSLNEQGDAVVQVSLIVKTEALNAKRARMHFELAAPDTSRLAYGYRDIALDMRGEDTVGFTAIVPRQWLWSPDSPSLLTLTVQNRISGRVAETVVLPVGVREVVHEEETLRVNGERVQLSVATVSGGVSLEELLRLKSRGCNAVTVAAGEPSLTLYDACDAVGLYVVAQAGIDTSRGRRSTRRGGNASNDPRFTDEYLRRTSAMYHTAKSHPSVIVFSLGHGVTNGINPYESYMWIKSTGDTRAVVYDAAGEEWNNDLMDMKKMR